MTKSILTAAFSSVAMVLALTATGAASAGDPVQCRQWAELSCSPFYVVGSPEWVSCVEFQTKMCIMDAAAPVRIAGKAELGRESCELL